MTIRMVILAVLGASLLPAALSSTSFLAGEVVGAATGIALALWGAKRTRFLTHNGQLCYVPHTYAGIAISLLVVGRIAYRFTQVYAAPGIMPPNAAAGDSAAAPASMVQSPLTVGIFYVLIGYYLCYYGWLLWKSKHIVPDDLEAPEAPPAVARAQSDVTPG
jgi:cytochrome b561